MNILLPIAAFWPMAGALICVLAGRRSDKMKFLTADAVMMIEFGLMMILLIQTLNGSSLSFQISGVFGTGLHLKLDGFRITYGLIAAFMWLMTTIFTEEYLHHYQNKMRYLAFTLATCGATVGVFFSADLLTTFVFFEIMSFTSYIMVIHDQNKEALRAGETYIAVAVIGGMAMLMGLFILYQFAFTLEMNQLFVILEHELDNPMIWIAGILILCGFGAKAGLYPLHIWLPKAHPVAPAPASALLSGILTKAGIFGMIVITMEIFREEAAWGALLLGLGVITMVLGAVLAVFSCNLKRTLACSSMSQVGFITVGLAMCVFLGHHNALAVRGTVLHMVNHSLIKLLLFMCAGVIYMNLHELDLNKIRGFGRNKTLLKILFLIGALSISGVPLFSGYVSKTLIHESILEYIPMTDAAGLFSFVETVFVIAGGLTFSYMTKLFVCIFVEKNSNSALQKKYDDKKNIMNAVSSTVLIICAVVLFLLGIIPNITANAVADFMQSFLHGHSPEHAVHYFSSVNLIGGGKSLLIGALVYAFVIRGVLMSHTKDHSDYLQRWPNWLDLENLLYRPLVQHIIPFIFALLCRIASELPEALMKMLNHTLLKKVKIKVRDPKDFEPASLVSESTLSPMVSGIESSLSFSLLLFGLGVVLAMIYMLTSLF